MEQSLGEKCRRIPELLVDYAVGLTTIEEEKYLLYWRRISPRHEKIFRETALLIRNTYYRVPARIANKIAREYNSKERKRIPKVVVNSQMKSVCRIADPSFKAELVRDGPYYKLKNVYFFKRCRSSKKIKDQRRLAKKQTLDYVHVVGHIRRNNPDYPYPA